MMSALRPRACLSEKAQNRWYRGTKKFRIEYIHDSVRCPPKYTASVLICVLIDPRK
jgi:hypothetical protein